jgi:molybdate transport system substrate-binding protein
MKNVVVYGGNCSRLVNLITMKKVDAIIGWRVVHFWNPGAMDFIPIDGKSLVRISYIPIAIPVYARDRTESQRFIDYVVSEKGKNIYRKHGYITDKTRARSYAGQAAIGGEYTLPAAYFQLVRQPRP